MADGTLSVSSALPKNSLQAIRCAVKVSVASHTTAQFSRDFSFLTTQLGTEVTSPNGRNTDWSLQ
jgi:hypothetical protein